VGVIHKKVSAIPDEANTALVRPSDWNDDHILVGANVGAVVVQGDAVGGLAAIPSVTAGQVLVSNGVGVAPSFQTDTAVRSVALGGTGLSALGAGLQVLRVNAGATALEYAAASSGAWTIATASTLTGAQHNWAPGLSGNTYVAWNGASDVAFTGIAGGVAGQFLTVKNITAAMVATFAHNSASSSAGNKLQNVATSGVTPLAPGGTLTYQYDGTDWQLLNHEQGAFIEYAATSTVVGWSSFTAGRKWIRYLLAGRRVYVYYHLEGPSNATTVSLTLPFTSFAGAGGYPAVYGHVGFSYDNTAYRTNPGVSVMSPNGATLTVQPEVNPTTAWTASGTKIVAGEAWYESA